MQSPTYAKNKRACEFWIRGTGRGVLEHPQHSLPPNTTCLYHMQGIDTSGPSGRNIIYRRPSFSAPRFRVWFSVLKFYVTNALNPNLPEDEYCGSHLNIWDGPMRISPGCSDIFCDKERSVQMSRATSPQSVIVGRPPTNATLVARFCRERAPRTCEHALLRRSRACAKTESFLSKGDSPVFFKTLYEFVDLHQDGEPWGRGPCSRRFSSRSFPEAPPDPPVNFSSPRDVFLYGRGGMRNISCTYRFEAKPGEVIRLRVNGVRSGGRLCRSVHSAHSPCDVGDYEFTSTSTVAELKFDVVNMTATDDFRSFGFEASVEFVRLDWNCKDSHHITGAKPEVDNFTLINNITVAPDLRHLCRTPNRIAVFAGGLSPIFICPIPPNDDDEIVEIFSDGWTKVLDPLARHVFAPAPSPDRFDLDWPRSLAIELIASESGSYYVSWLELSRRHPSSRGGVYALSGECAYRCTSLDACIAPALWCDGVAQCPGGEDERLAHCSALLRVPAHNAFLPPPALGAAAATEEHVLGHSHLRREGGDLLTERGLRAVRGNRPRHHCVTGFLRGVQVQQVVVLYL
ncbi:Low density lipoprotein receptor-related protein-like protein [Operophtera brumata]|uniref:Low density lipoprotein receptor-related protein-like protein n=1 Tax=Operophtera brumata TaxID=104452 RepID=A0A0L7KNG2_OPEBR|nr:Low density lipoprotein receptor-related protein-like protein [Operophtera brumata]